MSEPTMTMRGNKPATCRVQPGSTPRPPGASRVISGGSSIARILLAGAEPIARLKTRRRSAARNPDCREKRSHRTAQAIQALALRRATRPACAPRNPVLRWTQG
jgi:hypothetical protein